MSTKLIFVTGNAGKVAEVQERLKGTQYTIEQRVLDLPEIQGTPEEVAEHKITQAAIMLNDPEAIIITEDTSLCFDALNGLPGAYIKDFLKNLGVQNLYRMISDYENKGAYAQTIFAARCDGEINLFAGRTMGKIVPPRGLHEFCGKGASWDQAFEFNEEHKLKGLTYGEMSFSDKVSISHRSRALDKLLTHLNERSAK